MKRLKRFFALAPMLALWVVFSVLVWGSVFVRVTDAPREQKLVVCADTEVPGSTDLSVLLEEKIGSAARLVQVRPFSYAMFSGDVLTNADLLIVPASHIDTYLDWFAPLPASFREQADLFSPDGAPLGIRIYRADTRQGAAAEYIQYAAPETEAEDYYLLFGAQSLHNAELDAAVDDLSEDLALLILALP